VRSRVLVGTSERKRPLGRPRLMWEDDIKTDLQEVEWESVNWIDLAQDTGRREELVITTMNIRVA
jgi:hypothetical protein